ncbi:lamin tail domain-containing protein [Thermodesulfobacteriota bacterium]
MREFPDAKDNDCDGMSDEGLLNWGDVIITEIMKNPSAVDDSVGEWFEVFNRSDIPVNMDAWIIRERSGGADLFVVDEPGGLIVQPGGVLVFCRNGDYELNGGVVCDYTYDNFVLSNNDDEIILELDGIIVSEVWYDDLNWPDPNGSSMNFDSALFVNGNPNEGDNWCSTPGEPAYQLVAGDYGTPGRINPSCSGDPTVTLVIPDNGLDVGGEIIDIRGSGFAGATDVLLDGVSCAQWSLLDDNTIECTTPPHPHGEVDVTVVVGPESGTLTNGFIYTGLASHPHDPEWCDLHWPASILAEAGTWTEIIYGRVIEPGTTGYGCPATGSYADLWGEVGYGPPASDPSTEPGWTWTRAFCSEPIGAADEYVQTLTVPTPGDYAFGYRFSIDRGHTYMYCDFDPGTTDGFDVEDLGSLVVE